MKAKIKLTGDWKRLKKALENNPVAVNKHIKRATLMIGKHGEALVRQGISNGEYAPNAPLTIALKGADEPLIGDNTGAPLFKAITSTMVDDHTVFVGVLQKDKQYNIAMAIHNGTTIGVTAKMRGLFYVLWLKEQNPATQLNRRAKELWDKMPGGWKPLKKTTHAITIPPRPFINKPLETGELQKIAEKVWSGAMNAAIREASR